MTTVTLTAIYKLGGPRQITSGVWYRGVQCHRCAKNILILPMRRAEGEEVYYSGPDYDGPGKLNIACYHCGTESNYSGQEFGRFKSDHDATITKTDITVSKSDPDNIESFTDLYRHAEYMSEVATKVGNLCSACSHLEAQLIRLMFGLENIYPLSARHLAARFDYRSCLDTSLAICKSRKNEHAEAFIKSINNDVNDLQRERNLFIHGYVIHLGESNSFVWVTLRGKDAFRPQSVDLDRVTKAHDSAVTLAEKVENFCEAQGYGDVVLLAMT